LGSRWLPARPGLGILVEGQEVRKAETH
jgi:hypothetical protein